MSTTVKPTPIALIVCDNIYEEPHGKKALVGLFNNISAKNFPAYHPRLAVFASLTGLREGSRAMLDIVNAESDGEVVVSASGPFPSGVTPLIVVDMEFIFNDVCFKEEGMYFVRLWSNGHLLMQRPFNVVRARSSHDPDKPNASA